MHADIFRRLFFLLIFLLPVQSSLGDDLALPKKHIHIDASSSELDSGSAATSGWPSAQASVFAQVPFVGNIESMKYHRSDCEFARLMSGRKRISFPCESSAAFAGMKPCNWCLPRWSATVEGRLLITNQSAFKVVEPLTDSQRTGDKTYSFISKQSVKQRVKQRVKQSGTASSTAKLPARDERLESASCFTEFHQAAE